MYASACFCSLGRTRRETWARSTRLCIQASQVFTPTDSEMAENDPDVGYPEVQGLEDIIQLVSLGCIATISITMGSSRA